MTSNDSNSSDHSERRWNADGETPTPSRAESGARGDGDPRASDGSLNSLDISRRRALQLLGSVPVAAGTLGEVPEVARAQATATQTQKLMPASPLGAASFGWAVSLSDAGDLALIGAPKDGPSDSGAAHVFRLDGTWDEKQKLNASINIPPAGDDRFGSDVAIDDQRLLVGANFDDEKAADAGAAHVFDPSGDTWAQSDKVGHTDPDPDDRFGGAVALEGDTALIGALGDDGMGDEAGAAYVFGKFLDPGGAVDWNQTQKLTASDAAAFDGFGSSVAFTGTTGFIGAFTDSGAAQRAGAVYVFDASGGDFSWTESQKLTASDARQDVNFGSSVALAPDEETALIGAPFDGNGSAYVFEKSGDTWNEAEKLTTPDVTTSARFGSAVAILGDLALIGAHQDSEAASTAGAAFLFEKFGGSWSLTQKLTASDAAAADFFGTSVALKGTTALIGATGVSKEGQDDVGAVYVFDVQTRRPVVQVRDFRPIQVVENTVLRNPGGRGSQVTPVTPDLVVGRDTSILFNFTGSSNLDELPSGATVDVTVRRQFFDDSTESDTFQLTKSELQSLATAATDEAQFFASTIQRRDKLPIFELADNLDTITIEIDPDIDGDGVPDIGTTADTITLGTEGNFDTKSMDELRVGLIEIQDPEGGDNYGNSQGHIKGDSTTIRARLREYLQDTYPIDLVVDHEADPLDDDVNLKTSPGGDRHIVIDMINARAAIMNEFDDVDFDVTVALIPEDYFPFHNKQNWDGYHYGNARAAAIVRGDLIVDGSVDRLQHTGAQEIGHHFLGGDVYPDQLAMRRDTDNDGNVDEIDNAHARTRSNLDSQVIESTGFDLSGRYSLVGTGLDSFMSYSGNRPVWADAHAYQTMFDEELDAHSSSGGMGQTVVEGVGFLADDGSATFPRLLAFDGRTPTPSVPGATVTLTVLDANGDTLDERTVEDHLEASTPGPDPLPSHVIAEDVFTFVLPFPEETAEIRTEHDGTVTRLNPVERSLRDMIARLPDAAFKRSPDDRRAAFNDKLDSIDEMMTKGKYRPAKRKMENDIRDKVVKWLEDDYETGPLQPTKQELLELVDEMIARLERLSQDRSGGTGGGN